MKKYKAIPLLLAAALALSACEASDNIQAENDGTPSQTTTENAPQESGGENSGENTANEPEEGEGEPENNDDDENGGMSVEEVIATFEGDSFTTPDGTEVMLTEASSQMGDLVLNFDFAYIRYALPIYTDTDINPDLYDFESFQYNVDTYAQLEQKPFKVVKGDVLDNGLTVAEANYMVSPWDTEHAFENGVTLEGEWELEGILYRAPEDDYMIAKDEVLFYPNSNSGTVPASFDPYVAIPISPVDLHDEFAFMNDGGSYSLGDVNELDADIADWFGDRVYVKAKVTLDGLKIRYSENFGSQYWSTLKMAELVD